MHLNGWAVRHWRGLGEVELADLDPGLNLVLGENESGKSRLAQALWYGLFESSKGKAAHKLALAGWDGGGEPWVGVEFVAGGDGFRVEKTFGRASCTTRLQGAGGAWSGEEAEARLAELLRVGAPGGGRPVRDDELGVWPLLWVRQFHSARQPDRDLNDATRARLQDVLADAVGDVAAGPAGHGLLERARAERARYFTERGQERAPLKEAAAAVAAAEQAAAAAAAARREFEGAAAELEQLRGELARLEDDRRRTDARLQQARDAAAEAGRLRGELQAQGGQVRLLQEQLAGARREAELRVERAAALQRARADAKRVEREELRTLEAQGAERAAALEEAEAGLREAREALAAAAEDRQRARRQVRRGGAARRLGELGRRRERAGTAAAAARRAAERLAASGVDAAGVAELAKLQRGLDTARAQISGAATRVRLRAGADLVVDGTPLASGNERSWSCTDPLAIAIAGVGELEVAPGGEGLERLRDQADQLAARCRERCAALGVGSLEAAQLALQERTRLEQERDQAAQLLAELCPEGLEALDTAVAEATGELRALGEDDPEAPEEAAAEARHGAVEARVEAARGVLDARRHAAGEHRSRLAAARARRDGLEQVAAELQAQLQGMTDAAALESAVAERDAAWQRALATAAGLEARLAELGGDDLEATLVRLQRAREGLQADAEQLAHRRARLETTLDILAGQNLHEAEQEATAALAAAEETRRRLARTAAAARTLAETLETCRAESQARLLAPAVAAVGRHLGPLFPSARVVLEDDLGVAGLRTEAGDEPLLDLSGGTREQVGVAVRLGLAELLARGERLPLVLDDALTNTDFRRIETLHQILFAAAAELQILVFSCHPEAFAGLGAGRRYRLGPRPPR